MVRLSQSDSILITSYLFIISQEQQLVFEYQRNQIQSKLLPQDEEKPHWKNNPVGRPIS